MVTRSKKYREKAAVVEKAQYPLNEAISLAKEAGYASFDETIEVVFNLGIDSRKGDQQVRGSVSLPAGLGKEIRVAVIANGDALKDAEKNGATISGSEDLIEKIEKEGFTDFDVLLTTPDMMPKVGKLGKVLGRKGLMPSAKSGTVIPNIGPAIKEFKQGKIEYKANKNNSVHLPVGKKSFTDEQLKENYLSIYDALMKAKPSAAKGVYMKSIYLAPTMGPSVKVNVNS